jgi:chitinase
MAPPAKDLPVKRAKHDQPATFVRRERRGTWLTFALASLACSCSTGLTESTGASSSRLSVTQLSVNLQTSSGNYLDADQGGGGALMATSTWARSWETFTLTDLDGSGLEDGDIVTLQGVNGQWVTAAGGGGGGLTVTAPSARSWEQFRAVKLAGSGGIGDGDTFALQTTVGGQYVSANNGGGGSVTATAPWAKGWETLTLRVVASGCASAWIYLGNDANACDGNVGLSCGWTTSNEGQGYHCQTTSWGTGCEPGGGTCTAAGAGTGSGGGGRAPVFSPYKDTIVGLGGKDALASNITGNAFASDLLQNGASTATLAFATGECGSENWDGVGGASLASANVAALNAASVKYIISTGGGGGLFTCGSDAGMATFLGRWAGAGLLGVDFDIEAGQTPSVVSDLIARILTAHANHPTLRFSLTVATLGDNNGGSSAKSLGSAAPDNFGSYGDMAMAAVQRQIGFTGAASTWPPYLTMNLMAMDYGSPSAGNCVVSGSQCQMGQSALQAAYNLHDHWGVPYANIELTPMIGGNDSSSRDVENFTIGDAATVATFAISQGLAGVHYWAYDRDVDCGVDLVASPTCNTMGSGYAGTYGYLKTFLANGLR